MKKFLIVLVMPFIIHSCIDNPCTRIECSGNEYHVLMQDTNGKELIIDSFLVYSKNIIGDSIDISAFSTSSFIIIPQNLDSTFLKINSKTDTIVPINPNPKQEINGCCPRPFADSVLINNTIVSLSSSITLRR